MLPAIRAFFDHYRDAFNALDGGAVAQLYAVPSGIASDSGYEHWATREAIDHNMVALCTLYRQHGFERASYEVIAFIDQGERFAVADLRWSIARYDGQPPREFNTTYNLMRTNAGWRVLLCTAHSEQRLNAEAR